MRLQRIEDALADCQAHLASTNSNGTEIEAHLTRAMLVLTCAVFEETVEALIRQRAASLPEPAMRNFFISCIGAVFRSTRSSELAGLLNRFGAEFKESFNRRIEGHERAVTFYDNIVQNRHGVAHTQSLNVTLQELRMFYDEGHVVLDYLRDTIAETCVGSPSEPHSAPPPLTAGRDD